MQLLRGPKRACGPLIFSRMIEYAAMKNFAFILLFSLLSASATAGGVYQEPEAFIAEVFGDNVPSPGVIWPDKALKAQMKDILNHAYKGLRIRYWQQDDKTVWILDEIGKEKPITAGIVIKNGKIERVRILVFRESRGWEVRHNFFTEQFDNATLNKNLDLDRRIDNISGATLSVRAVTKLARIALLLDHHLATSDAGQ